VHADLPIMSERVGDFYVRLVSSYPSLLVGPDLVSSTKLLTQSGGPSVIHFYSGG
jgi:hypothetical protein